MKRYLFFTYGEPGWRGVQMRAIRMAQYLPKDDVLFWNLYDSEFIQQNGFAVETKQAGLVDPNDIQFPEGVEVVIFADIPSNELFEYCLFQAAVKQQKKIVICEQLYKKDMMQQYVFEKFSQLADLVLLNSLSVFQTEETEAIKIVPPQIEMEIAADTRKKIHEKFGVPADSLVIFGAGYNEQVFAKIRQLTKQLEKNYTNFVTIVSGPSEQKDIVRDGQLIISPFLSGDDYFELLAASDIVLVKFGFLQILESLALHKPTIVLGEAGYVLQNPDVVDSLITDNVVMADDVDGAVTAYVERLLSDESYRQDISKQLEALHNGELFGAKKAARLIEELAAKKGKKKVLPAKRLVILVNNEVFEQEAWLKEHDDVYPLCFIIAMPTEKEVIKRLPEGLVDRPIKDLQLDSGDILPHSFKEIFVFSRRKADGLLDIFPWFEDWIRQVKMFMAEAEEIYLTKQGEKLLGELLVPEKEKVKQL